MTSFLYLTFIDRDSKEMDVAERIINQAKENLKDLQKAFTTSTLKFVRHV
jgi:hypothetical protein